MSYKHTNKALYQNVGNSSAKSILLILAAKCRSNNRVTISLSTLCDLSFLSRNTVLKALTFLESKKFLKKHNYGENQENVYELLLDNRIPYEKQKVEREWKSIEFAMQTSAATELPSAVSEPGVVQPVNYPSAVSELPLKNNNKYNNNLERDININSPSAHANVVSSLPENFAPNEQHKKSATDRGITPHQLDFVVSKFRTVAEQYNWRYGPKGWDAAFSKFILTERLDLLSKMAPKEPTPEQLAAKHDVPNLNTAIAQAFTPDFPNPHPIVAAIRELKDFALDRDLPAGVVTPHRRSLYHEALRSFNAGWNPQGAVT